MGTCWAPAAFAGSIADHRHHLPVDQLRLRDSGSCRGRVGEHALYLRRQRQPHDVSKDPLGRITSNSYDALNRLTQVLDPAAGTTKYAYNGNGVLKQVTDPRNLATTYSLNGFGETTTLASPDTGSATSTYDATGNLKTRLDARGVTATYTYDAINRVTKVVYSKSGTTSETHTFTYDGGTSPPPYSKGRLTQLVDTAGTTKWTYEAHGRVLTKAQTVSNTKTVAYAYNAAGQLASLTTPSGQVIGYTYSNNRISGVSINGAVLIGAAIAEPFGPLSTWNWGNGLVTLRVYDTDGRLTSWEFRNGTSILRNNVSWDVGGTRRRQHQSGQRDAGLRLPVRRARPADGEPAGQSGRQPPSQFNYDAVGNRSNLTVNGTLTNYSYAAASNQLLALTGATARSYVYDAAGNPTTIGSFTNTYNNANRLTKVMNGTTTVATYKVNALGQRVEKVSSGVTTRYVYDEQGHLLGEYDSTGKLVQETVWLEDLPVATLRPTGATGTPTPINVYYVLADHLGSPRAVVRPSDNQFVWRWDNTDPFGANVANENPAGQGSFKYALRFPGQYYDAETGTHYNYFRDYDPAIGRYEQSDPIGLPGGMNTYAYVNSAPLKYADSLGLSTEVCTRPLLVPLPGRHCYVRFNGDAGDTLSYDPHGVHADDAWSWWPKNCTPTKGDEADACVRREMKRCESEQYDYLKNNCCHCAEAALRACGLSAGAPWPNWPINPAPPPRRGEPIPRK